MSDFKRQFIVLDGTQENLDKAIEKVEELGYREWRAGLKFYTDKLNILILDEVGEYFLTNDRKENLINRGYTIISFEEFLKEEIEIKPGELVGVDCLSQEEADKDFRVNPDRYYIGKNREGLYVVEDDNGFIDKWEYISNTLPKEETIEIKTKDGQTLSITKEKAIELGFKID